MDFEAESDRSLGNSHNDASSSLVLSSQSSDMRVSFRSITNGSCRNARKRPVNQNFSDDEEVSKGSSESLIVRGAGTSALAVQDAGTVQMLKDECSYLCSAILSARSPSQALDTALELANLLASKKSRNILWQSCVNKASPSMSHSPQSSGRDSSMDDTTPTDTMPATRTILDAILDVIACVANGSSTSKPSKLAAKSTNVTSNVMSSNTTRAFRTKSARRKLKQQQLLGPQDSEGMGLYWSRQTNARPLPEISQILALMVYYISLDCTLSKEHSAAAMGVSPKPATARIVRNIILQHAKALKGIVQLCVRDEARYVEKDSHIPTSIHPPDLPTKWQSERSSRMRQDENTLPNDSISPTPTQDSLSSLSVGGDSLPVAITSKGSGDPTKVGRLNRRRRRLQESLFDTLPAVPEGNDLDDLYRPEDKIVPPPNKRPRRVKKGDSKDVKLSFSSGDANSLTADNDSYLFSEPLSTAGTEVTSRVQLSPDNQSAGSTVVSIESITSLVTVRFALKLKELRSKVHLSSSVDYASLSHQDCGAQSQLVNQWVSHVCLESLSRIITGKECDGPSCLSEDQRDDDAPSDDEESNPLLQTNRQLGKSGIIPLLAQCMSEELRYSFKTSKGGLHCQVCHQHWNERISILASIIDGACLFNKANRRSLAEHYDPFSFEHDPLQNKTNQGLIHHILGFLCNVFPSQNRDGMEWQGTADLNSSDFNTVRSGVRLLALRTLTSLTHDNELAAQQMIAFHNFEDQASAISFDEDYVEIMSSRGVRGIDVLAQLVFELESGSGIIIPPLATSCRGRKSRGDDESHRYDSTIFCLNTLVNIIESSAVRRLLAEITVSNAGGESELWIQWLCKWLVQQTYSFRDAILGTGNFQAESQGEERALEKSEDDKLVAAGNGCVLLACLMTDSDQNSDDPDSTTSIRKLILGQMPLDNEGKPTGATMVINTLKAFCNFYHFSLGELSLAIVGPVKKLIDGLEELRNSVR